MAKPAVAPEVLFPNCPYVLSPQQYAWPVFERAHACDIPLVTCTYPRVPLTVGELVTVAVRDAVAVNATVDVNVGPVVALTVADGVTHATELLTSWGTIDQTDCPAWLLSFAPQQDAAPDAVSPHVCVAPSTNLAHRRPGVTRMSGARIVPLETIPFAVCCAFAFAPQHRASPVRPMPQVCTLPAVSDDQPNPPAVATGVERWLVVASPSWPESFRPQQYARAPAVVIPQV
jgi:hypothetical protein